MAYSFKFRLLGKDEHLQTDGAILHTLVHSQECTNLVCGLISTIIKLTLLIN